MGKRTFQIILYSYFAIILLTYAYTKYTEYIQLTWIMSISILLIISLPLCSLLIYMIDLIITNMGKDALTGLHTRKHFSAIEEVLESAKSLLVVALDIDNFSSINELYGHSKGDDVLQIFANELRRITRNTDFVLRLGKDEFMIVYTKSNDLSKKIVEQRVQDAIKNTSAKSGLKITVSRGYACFPEDATVLDALIKIADANMKKDKYKTTTK